MAFENVTHSHKVKDLGFKPLNGSFVEEKEFEVGQGLSVIIYKVEIPTLGKRFFIVTFDDGSYEVLWSASMDLYGALNKATKDWDRMRKKEDPYNPFRQVIYKLIDPTLEEDEERE